jgi:hypothetical protein
MFDPQHSIQSLLLNRQTTFMCRVHLLIEVSQISSGFTIV